MKLLDQISGNEKILWHGRKEKGVSVLESIFNPLMPFALVWALFDGAFIFGFGKAASAADGGFGGMGIGIAAFFLIHLMPVWLYLFGILTSGLQAKNTEYAVTDRGVYIKTGIFSSNVVMKPFAELSSVSVRQGMFDKMCGTGDVTMNSAGTDMRYGNRSRSNIFSISNVKEYESVFQLVKQYQEAVYTDTMFPNQMRPAENPGYRTQFTGSIAHSNASMQAQQGYAPQGYGQPAFGGQINQQPVFSDPQRGFDAVRGSYAAGGAQAPQQTFGIPQNASAQPQAFGNPQITPAQQQTFGMPQNASAQPQAFGNPQSAPVQPQTFGIPQITPAQQQAFGMPQNTPAQISGFDMPELPDIPDIPQPADRFLDPTLPQAQTFRDPTQEYFDRNHQNGSF